MTLYWKAVASVALVAFLAASFRILVLGAQEVMVVPNDFAVFLVMLPFVRWLMNRWAFLLAVAIATAASMAIDSRLCLALCAANLIWGEWSAIRWNAKAISMGVAALCLLVVLSIQTGFIDKLQQWPTSRIPVWDAALHQIQEAPLLGSGALAFGPYYAEHIQRTAYPDFIAVDGRDMPWAHNLFLDVAVSFGIPVSALILALLLAVLWKSLREEDQLGNAVFGSVLLFLLASMVEFTHLRLYTVVLIAVYAGYLLSNPSMDTRNRF